MSTVTERHQPSSDWEQEIRALEERGRVAFLAGELPTLDEMWDPLQTA